jgi:Ser/Thr protein kinase RdoA (MazF antagonist)
VTLAQESVFGTVLSPLEALRAHYQLASHEEKLIDGLKEQMSQLADQPLPLVCQHGDFWTGNILWKDGKISGIVDWEHSCFEALPFRDLFLFAYDAGLMKRDGSLRSDEFIRAYFAQMNLDDRFTELFWPVILATLATRECGMFGEQPTTFDWHFRKLFGQYALSVGMEREL